MNRQFSNFLLIISSLVIILTLNNRLIGQENPQARLPVMQSVTRDDPVYRQMQQDLEGYYIAQHGNEPAPPLAFFILEFPEGERSLFSLAAKLELPYETVATLNRIANPADAEAGINLVIPNAPGLFIPVEPESAIELMLFARNKAVFEENSEVALNLSGQGQVYFYYIPGERFTGTELAYFLGHLFRTPLPAGVITSRFGARIGPFSGSLQFHRGLDLAAPRGTPVYAARDGVVSLAEYSSVYGNYIIITHQNNYTTLYGHFSEIVVNLGQRVTTNTIVGRVGSSGMSTGPHLHFELRQNGQAVNPLSVVPGL